MLQLCFNESDFYHSQTLPLSPERCAPFHKPEQCYLRISFQCRWDTRYVGRTSLTLEDRIKQHIPFAIRNNLETGHTQPSRTCKNPTGMPAQSDVAIGHHLLNNPDCAQDYHVERFQIVARAHIKAHLHVLEDTFIHTRAPVHCKQKEYVQTMHLF